MDPFSAVNLVFLIPLIVGLILAAGSAFGMGEGGDSDHDLELDAAPEPHMELGDGSDIDLDHDLDVGHDLEIDQDFDHDYHGTGLRLADSALDGTGELRRSQPLWLRLLSLVGIGRVPMTIVAMTGTLLFGGIGISCNILLGSVGFLVSLMAASVGSLALTGIVARVVARLIPSTESSAVGRDQLCGKVAVVSLGGGNGYAVAHVLDEHGTLHQIPCATDSDVVLKPRDEVIVVSYDDATGRFFVAPLSRDML